MCSPLVSVIIPVYNREHCIKNTVYSVLENDYSNIEVICMDDGSSDNSLTQIKEIAQKDPRVKCFTQNNQGVSVARNNALKKAEGKYVLFLDSDDYIEKETIKTCVEYLEPNNADIICFNMLVKEQNGDQYISFGYTHFEDYLIVCYAKDYSKAVNFTNAAPCLIKKDFIINNNINFVPNRIYEDWLFMVEIFSKNPYCIFLNKAMYIYNRTTNQSITHDYSKTCLDIFYSYRKSNEIIENCKQNSEWARVNDYKIIKDATVFWQNNLLKYSKPDICESYINEIRSILIAVNTVYLEELIQNETFYFKNTIEYILKNKKFNKVAFKKYIHRKKVIKYFSKFASELMSYIFYIFKGLINNGKI